MFQEACEFFGDEFLRMSCDDKNKINVGTLTVSRYHQITRFFLADDAPDYMDQDFWLPGYKITPSSYLVLDTH